MMQGDWKVISILSAIMGVLLLIGAAHAESPYTLYRQRSQAIVPMPYGPVAYPGATSGIWTNPAGIGIDGSSGFLFTKPASTDGYSDYMSDDLAWGVNLSGLGFGAEYVNGKMEARRYTIGTAFGDDGFTMGVAYHWSDGLPLQNAWDLGMLARPTRWLSVGATAEHLIGGDVAGEDTDPLYRFGLGVRPFGSWLTLTGDLTMSNVGLDGSEISYFEEMDPTFTASVRPIDGLTVRGGYAIDSEVVFAGLSVSLGNGEIGGWGGTRTNDENGGIEDAGTNWVRLSSHWEPTLWDPFKPKKIVKMKLRGRIVEEQEPWSLFGDRNPTLLSKIDQLDQIAKDDDVSGVWLDLDGLSAQFSDLEELRAAIQRVKDSGKKVIVYNDNFGLGQYYLASAADKIYMLPTGVVAIPGLNVETLHLKRMLEKIHVTPQAERIGEYKSAAEMFISDSLSDDAEEALGAVLDDYWDELTGKIAEGRHVERGDVEQWINDVLHSGRNAKDAGIVDDVAYDDEIRDMVRNYIGDDDIIGESSYFMQQDVDYTWDDMTSPKIAVIFAEGPIMTGNSGRGFWDASPYIGAETVARAIRNARSNPRVKAIVMRVDSPGGSAEASDIIAREVKRTVEPGDKDTKAKPFIVSMSGVAASGGYYISAYADTIVAPSTSVTGSIGVLAVNLGIKDGLLDTLGIVFDPLYRGKNAGIFSGRTWNDEQRGIIRGMVETTYKDFTGVVSEGRGMTVEEVDNVGRGRVWSGKDAIDINLVDLEGGLYESIQLAKDLADVPEGELVELELYVADHPIWEEVDRELKASAFEMLPESVQRAVIVQQTLSAFDSASMQMLAPVDMEGLIME